MSENNVQSPGLASKRLCSNWLDAYVEYTSKFEPPAMFARWAGVLTLACATGHKVWLEEANTRIWPNLYVVLVGPSGVGKGMALREALPFIKATGIPISPDKITIPKLTLSMASQTIVDEELGCYTPYLVWAEELPSFLGLDAYKSGKLADLTSLYDCAEKWESGTKTAGDDVIPNPFVCMAAGATASSLFDVLPPASVGQGFTSRLIFIHVHHYNPRVAEKPWVIGFHDKLQKALMHDIEIISKMRGPMRMSDVARVYWNDYYLNRPSPQEEYGDERMQGYAARKPFYAKKVAMLLSLAERPTVQPHSMLVEAHHLERAFVLLSDVDRSLVDVYGEIAADSVRGHYAKVVRHIAKQPGMQIDRSNLARRFAYALSGPELSICCKQLVEMRVIEEFIDPASVGKQWKPRTLYRVIPGRENAFEGKKVNKKQVWTMPREEIEDEQ